MKREDNWVNLTKVICILVVLLGHYNYTEWVGTGWLTYIVKSAVYVMFVYSGYYLCRNKTLEEHEKTKGYLGHLGIMAVVWAILYFLNKVFYSDRTIDAVSEIFQDTMSDFTRFNYSHLWYIQCLFLAVAIMYGFQKKHFKVWEILLLALLQICCHWNLLCALAAIGIGFIFAETDKLFNKCRLIICLCTGTVAAVILCGFSYEWFRIWDVCEEVVIEVMRFALAAAVALTGLCMDSLVPLDFGRAGRYVRKLSTCIYLTHLLFVNYSFKVASDHGALWGEKAFFLYSTGTAVLFSFAAGSVLIAVSEIKPFRLLKKIF